MCMAAGLGHPTARGPYALWQAEQQCIWAAVLSLWPSSHSTGLDCGNGAMSMTTQWRIAAVE